MSKAIECNSKLMRSGHLFLVRFIEEDGVAFDEKEEGIQKCEVRHISSCCESMVTNTQ